MPNARTQPTDDSPCPRLADCHAYRWFGLVFAGALAYVVVRYHVFKGVEWIHLPLYVMNKAVSLAAVALVASSYLVARWAPVLADEPGKRVVLARFLGLSGFALAAAHVVMSLALLSPAYYEKLFGAGQMNLTGELSILFGLAALWFLSAPVLTSLPNMEEALGSRRWRKSQRLGYLAQAAAAGHVLVMGVSGWLTPAKWPGSMPPVTMLAFVAALIPLLARLLPRRPVR